jgi:hypothetical protein
MELVMLLLVLLLEEGKKVKMGEQAVSRPKVGDLLAGGSPNVDNSS